MDNEFEQLSVEFNTRAQRLFFLIYERFRFSTKRLDRTKDENVFQQELAKYLYTLKLQLENIASELMYKNKALKDINKFNRILIDKIDSYLNEFTQKSKAQ
ncbi:MAG TPA: hypothetical protein VJ765_00495 [Chitinophagaceae bacterium]|nr:hypothetical protein [Chitinophagaceae bacterium]